MAYNPYPEKLRQVRQYFMTHPERHPGMLERLDALEAEQSLASAQALVAQYFTRHPPGDLRGLRHLAAAFADKRLVRNLVGSILEDEEALLAIAQRSYPHPIGFDKLVLHDHSQGDPRHHFKLRLHIYWRSPQEVAAELNHLHRFEMASSPITGELTNHLYAVRWFEGEGGVVTHPGGAGGEVKRLYAYSGYERGPDGTLRKRFLGCAGLERLESVTYVPGQSYVQSLEHAHYVETNAETGHTNGDICSTVFLHGAALTDAAGRRLPFLFEENRVPDTTVARINALAVGDLDRSLRRYRSLLDESLHFYDWLYDARYGRNLSVGLVAGYFLCEAFDSLHTLEMWEKHRHACVDVLRTREAMLGKLLRKEVRVESLPQEERNTRYFQQLVNKAWEHPGGAKDWLSQYGDLVKEFERYLGALVGDYARKKTSKVLKPIWEMDTRNLRGGAHYGNIWAMLEAVRRVEPLILERFRSPDLKSSEGTGEGPVTEVEQQVFAAAKELLTEHFPHTRFEGEEDKTKRPLAREGESRWLVDSIDGTRNFIHGNKNFAVSIAHQIFKGNDWLTTDAVVSLPAHGETYWAELGEGAYLIERDGSEKSLRLAPGPGNGLQGGLVDLSIRGLGRSELRVHERLMELGVVRRATGAAALMLAMVSGTGNTGALITANDYDVVAGLLVAAEAGARVSTRSFQRDGRTFTVYIVSESPAVQGALEALIDEAVAHEAALPAARR